MKEGKYGYIDKTGTIVIAPQFLNATNFENGHALIIAPSKEVIGFNKLFFKGFSCFYFVIIIILD